MGKVRTSAIFYRRGVPDQVAFFGVATQANYPVVQPNSFLNYNYITNLIQNNKNRYINPYYLR
jgi:hypothetical protein